LTKAGRKLVAHDHGRLTVTALITQKIDGHTATSTRKIKLTRTRKRG
jgi:hypothetical protein